MAQIICLANSLKHQGRCVAGICVSTGRWIRPIIRGKTAIYEERFIDGINGNEPELMDLLEISIGERAPDEGCQPENYYMAIGKWRKVRQLTVSDVSRYVENTTDLLHNQDKKVDPSIFISMPRSNWKSLQLVRVRDAEFVSKKYEKTNYYCNFTYSGIRYELKLTDMIAIGKIEAKKKFSNQCILTVSMATPFKTPAYEKPYCWKMVAGVIELD